MKFTTKNMSYMALFAAMQIVLEYCTKIWEMPQGGTVAFSLIAIFLCGYLMDYKFGFMVSMICLGLHFVLGLASYWGMLSLLFDYIIPMALIGLCCAIPLIKIGKVEFPLGIVVACVLKTICHLISGWYAFQTPLAGNLAYNLPYNIATLIACVILFMVLYPRLKKTIHA